MKAEELFRAQFLTTVKIVVIGLLFSFLGYYLGGGTVNPVVVTGLAIVTVSPLISFYLVLRKFKRGNIK